MFHFKKSSLMKRKRKKKKEGEGERETATQHATETFFFPQLFLYEAGAAECGKEGFFLETSLWEGKKV